MCEPISMGIMAGVTIAGGALSAYSDIQQGNYQANVARMNAKFADQQATSETLAGEANAEQAMAKAGKFAGSQRAQFAGAGVDVNSGSSLDVLADTRIMSNADVATIKSNAARRAHSYEAQAAGDTAEASQYETAGEWNAAKTLLGAAGSAAGYGIKGYSSWKANGGNLFPVGS